MAEEVKPIYKCTQEELYSGAETVVENLVADMDAFDTFKTKYNGGFVDVINEKIAAARALPGETDLAYGFVQARIELDTIGLKCTNNFQTAKRYIDEWRKTKPEREAAYNAAGQARYAKAVNDNWEEVKGLNTSLSGFIGTNAAVLAAEGYMPPDFQGAVDADKETFITKYNNFKSLRETTAARDAKITANNGVYTDIMGICDDGKVIFKNDPGRAKRYTWGAIMDIISPPGSASLTITVLQEGTNLPQTGLEVEIQKEGGIPLKTTTDSNGEVKFESIDPGVYSCKVKRTGQPDVVFTKDVDMGVNARKEVFI